MASLLTLPVRSSAPKSSGFQEKNWGPERRPPGWDTVNEENRRWIGVRRQLGHEVYRVYFLGLLDCRQRFECGFVPDQQSGTVQLHQPLTLEIAKGARDAFAGAADQLGELFVGEGQLDADSTVAFAALGGPADKELC